MVIGNYLLFTFFFFEIGLVSGDTGLSVSSPIAKSTMNFASWLVSFGYAFEFAFFAIPSKVSLQINPLLLKTLTFKLRHYPVLEYYLVALAIRYGFL